MKKSHNIISSKDISEMLNAIKSQNKDKKIENIHLYLKNINGKCSLSADGEFDGVFKEYEFFNNVLKEVKQR